MRTVIKRPTIRDVAAEAGVSKSLVSLVYSSPASVSNKRKEKVLAAAEKLGYAPNFLARSLAADSGTFIAILVADLHNPLFAQIADQIRVQLEREKRHYFITSAMIRDEAGEPFLDKQTVKSIIDLRPESLLVIGSIPRIEILEALPKNIPIVIASGVPSGMNRALTIRTNEEAGMELAIEHLVGLGHSKISHISGNSPIVGRDRSTSYEMAMTKNGLSKNISIIKTKIDDEANGYLAAKEVLNKKIQPTAIVCFNDLVAIGAQAALIESHSKISLVGFDNTYLSGLSQIDLTSVDPGNNEIAAKCSEVLLSGELTAGTVFYSKPTLVIRGSSRKNLK